VRKLKPLRPGYNLIEEELIGKKYEDIEEKISILEFLRRLKRKQPVSRKIAVIGFDELIIEGPEVARIVRSILSRAVEQLRNHIIQLPIGGRLVMDMEPKLRLRGREVRLALIFGNRLEIMEPGYFYSPLNI